jgi:predicted ATPase
MQQLFIQNFGPITEVEVQVEDFTVFIGPQASGKSTISKTIYLFKL